MASIQSPGVSLSNFLALAKTEEAVALTAGMLKPTATTPAKAGFFARFVQWIRGESASQINRATKNAFIEEISKGIPKKHVNALLTRSGFHAGSDKPLSSREIKNVFKEMRSLKNTIEEQKSQMQQLMNETENLHRDLQDKTKAYRGAVKNAGPRPNSEQQKTIAKYKSDYDHANKLFNSHCEKINSLSAKMIFNKTNP